MTSNIYDFIRELEGSWHEVDVLIEKSKQVRDTEADLYNAMCRSISVLILAHLEGYVKKIVKYIIKDLNSSISFKDLPLSIKRTYCTKYLGLNFDKKDKNYQNKVTMLIDKFDEINCDISEEPFFYTINKNPKGSVIKNIFFRFGDCEIFQCLHESDFDEVFSITLPELKKRIASLKSEILVGVNMCPYIVNDEKYKLNETKHKSKTLWEEFLDEINQKRHAVAHGNEVENVDDINTLEYTKFKVLYLELILVYVLCFKVINYQKK